MSRKTDVFIHQMNPAGVVTSFHGRRAFEVEFPEDRAWLTDRTLLADGSTVGEMNCRRLHDMLDEYINEYIKRGSNG